MEDVLDLYAEPYRSDYPVVCFDEVPYQLVSEVRKPLPAQPGKPIRYDYEYRREGTCNLFIFLEPLAGRRHVKVTARRLVKILEFHYTPKHSSWLNMAEVEISVLSGQCLDRRIGNRGRLESEISAWQTERNERKASIDWRFTIPSARDKLKRLYPVPERP